MRPIWLLLCVACGVRQARLKFYDDGPAWPPPPDVPHVRAVGTVKAPMGGFRRPIDVACGKGHRIAVADAGGSAVWVLDLDGGRALRTIGGGALSLETPVGVAFMPDGRVLAVDADRKSVFVLRGRRGGATVAYEQGPLVRPTAIAWAGRGLVYLVDTGAHRVYQVDLAAGELFPLGGDHGSTGEGFNFPVDIAVNSEGSVFVADALNAVVQRLDGVEPVLFAGGPGYGGPRLVRPKGLAIDSQDRVHVVDAGMQHVQVYDKDGAWLGRYGQPGDGPGELGLPGGLCIDDHGHIFVADSLNNRVQVYQIEEDQ